MPFAEPIISCPNCKAEIKLTESLAAPLVEATRREYERRLVQMQENLIKDRERIATDEARKAKLLLTGELEGKAREIGTLQQVLRDRDQKLAEAQRVQTQFLQKTRALDDKQRELDLIIERRVQEGLSAVRAQARSEAEEHLKLKVLEKEQTIASMQRQIEELRRKAEQGSQQLQGEAQELQLEVLLTARFPFDIIDPVRKGEHGGDVLQRVANSQGGCCGSILWEAKRTKNWSDAWLAKLRDNQRAAKAEVAVIVSHVLPKDIETFELVEGVWVIHPKVIVPVAVSLRHMLIEVACVRQSAEGQQTKAEMVYGYLTGPRFRQRVQAMVEAFSDMQEDLEKERKVMLKQWAKRQEQIERVMQATVGMYGDLQGIAGKTIGEIEGLSMDTFALTA
jgi:hypothetical protein